LQDYQIVGPAIHSVKRNFKPCPTEVMRRKYPGLHRRGLLRL
jgi:hypothetical protein